MMTQKEIEVHILGKSFGFSIPDNIANDDFLEIVRFVEKKINKIRGETEDLDSFKLGLLAAINIAEEYFQLKKENENLRVILNKIDRMLSPLGEGDQLSISFSS